MGSDLLQWLNVLLIPMGLHAIRTGERIAKLEAKLEMLIRPKNETP